MSNIRQRIYLSPPHMSGKELKYVKEAFDTNWIAPLGPNVDKFEKEFSDYAGVRGAAAVSSGTAAIHLALRLLGVSEGDRVFCSTLTFVASANPIVYQSAQPVFIDSEPKTWNMSPRALKRAFMESAQEGNLPKAVIVAHLYGQSARMNEIMALCDTYQVPVIEDSAESLGSLYNGKVSGTMGKFGVYSFNGNKIITTSGGGMLISDDGEALINARFLATQARDAAVHYEHSVVGYNYRMSNILAGIGRGQLEVLEDRVKARRAVFDRYEEALSDLPGICFMPELEGTRTNRWLTTLTVDETVTGISSNQLIHSLSEENIEARPVWKPLHLQPLFAGSAYYQHQDDLNVAQQLFQTGICLPSGSNLSEEEQNRVIQAVRHSLRLPSIMGESL